MILKHFYHVAFIMSNNGVTYFQDTTVKLGFRILSPDNKELVRKNLQEQYKAESVVIISFQHMGIEDPTQEMCLDQIDELSKSATFVLR